MWWSDLSLQSIIFRVIALLIIVGIQGGIVAGAAVLLGDQGPKYDGRLSIAPSSHVDLVGSISLILFGFGWAKPMPIDARQFRTGRIGIFVVILAGVVGVLVTAAILHSLILPALTTLSHTAGLTMSAFLRNASSLSIWFALLSLIPIPPLTGGLLFGAFGIHVSQHIQWMLTAMLLVVLATGVVRWLLSPAHAQLSSLLFGG